MTSLRIEEASLPNLKGKVAIITGKDATPSRYKNIQVRSDPQTQPGGSSGIGHATSKILAARGAKVYSLDRNRPSGDDEQTPDPNIEFLECNVLDWNLMRGIFDRIGKVDMVFANAGISEETNTFTDQFDEENRLLEPSYAVVDVNLRGVVNMVKLAWHGMKKHGVAGSIVITTSATAYAPEQSLPLYAASKIAVSPVFCSFTRRRKTHITDT